MITVGPVMYYLVGGESARATLDGWKSWLNHHNAVVMTVLLLVIGVVLRARASVPFYGLTLPTRTGSRTSSNPGRHRSWSPGRWRVGSAPPSTSPSDRARATAVVRDVASSFR